MHSLFELITDSVEQNHLLICIQYRYVIVFGALFISGLGVPFPEEFSLILGGWLTYKHADLFLNAPPFPCMSESLVLMSLNAFAAILAGDLTIYCLGRKYGQSFLTHRWMRWVLSKQNHGRIEFFYERWGHWAVFLSRFVAGIRVGSFFLAGASGVKARTFLLMDGLGALLTVPLSVWLAWHFGEEIDLALCSLGTLFHKLVYAVALAALAGFWWQLRKARKAATPPRLPGAST